MTHWFIIRVVDEANFRAAWGAIMPAEKLVMDPGAGGKTLMTGSSRIGADRASRLTSIAKVLTEFPADWVAADPENPKLDGVKRETRIARVLDWFDRTFTSKETTDG